MIYLKEPFRKPELVFRMMFTGVDAMACGLTVAGYHRGSVHVGA